MPPTASAGRGTVAVNVDLALNRVCVSYNFGGLSAPATAAHIHQAPPGVSGPVVVPIAGVPNATAGGGTSCSTVSPALAQAIANDPAAFYVNIHDAVYPGGEIRGQLVKLS